MKIFKLILFLFFILNLFGCNKKHNTEKYNFNNTLSVNMLEENTIYWNKKSIFENSQFDKFFSEYLKDSLTNKNMFFFLTICGVYDTIFFVLSPVRFTYNNDSTGPAGILKKGKKLIFILDPLLGLIKHDSTDFVNDKYNEALESIKNKKNYGYKEWMLEVPLYGDSSIVVKDPKIIGEKLYNIKVKRVQKFDFRAH